MSVVQHAAALNELPSIAGVTVIYGLTWCVARCVPLFKLGFSVVSKMREFPLHADGILTLRAPSLRQMYCLPRLWAVATASHQEHLKVDDCEIQWSFRQIACMRQKCVTQSLCSCAFAGRQKLVFPRRVVMCSGGMSQYFKSLFLSHQNISPCYANDSGKGM